MTGLLHDVRFGLRQLRKSPGFTAVAVITLALGIGANTAIFSVMDAVLLRPLPFRNPSRIVAVKTTEPGRHDDIGVSYPAFLDWRTRNHVFEGLSAYREDDFTLTGKDAPLHVTGVVVSANAFSLLGIAPVLGRDFTAEEDAPSSLAVPVILSHDLWQERFGSSPNILGQRLTISGQVFTVVGVMPTGFQFPVRSSRVDFWTTIALDAQPTGGGAPPMTAQRGVSYLDVIARLKSGVTLRQAHIDMEHIQESLNKEYPENRPKGIAIVPELDDVVGSARLALLVLFGAVGLVLLIACANLSNLLLARATARQREISVRTALGATRWLVARQLLAESVLLAAAGATAGLAVAVCAIKILLRLAPQGLPRISQSGLNLQVLCFTAAVAVLTSLLFGLIPALHTARPNLAAALNEGNRTGTDTRERKRFKDTFVVVQTAFAVVLLAGAGLLLRSLLRLGKVDPGFAKDHVITFGLDLPSRYKQPQRVQFYKTLLPQIRTLPGVRSASAAFPLPLSADDVKTSFDVEGHPLKESDRPVTTLHIIDEDYFHALGVPLLKGREFDPEDGIANAVPVAVISQTLARQAFPGEDPVGKQIRPNISSGPGEAPYRVIVGVVGDVKAEGLATSAIPECYVPYAQLPFAPMSVVVRTMGDPENMTSALTKAVQLQDRDLPLLHVKTLDEYLDDSVAQTRFVTVLLGTFAALAFLLTAIGLYGVISYTVVQKTREMGIRLALGAERSLILTMIVKQGLWLVMVGTGLGVTLAFLLTRLIASMLYGVSPLDPLTFVCVPAALMTMAVLASYFPARRAAKVDPMVALRYE
jgi:putative ABC transport system permease protein